MVGYMFLLDMKSTSMFLKVTFWYSVTVLQAESEQDVIDWVNSLKMVNQLALNSDKTLASSFRIFGGGKVRKGIACALFYLLCLTIVVETRV
jgi:hypothetical protein